jgi:hypothetical protein
MPTKQDIYVFIIPETRHAHETGYLRFYYSRNSTCPRNRIFTFLLFQKRVMPTKQDIYVFIIPETRHAHETGYLDCYYSRNGFGGMTRFWNNNNLDILFRGHDAFLE